MDEAEVVASIVAGDHTGLAEALDPYAAPLFSFCRTMLPPDAAADAVQNTFVIARVRLDRLRDPGKLGEWLQAVARGECFRWLTAQGERPPAFITEVPAVPVPSGLPGKILQVCTEDTATARAHRASVAHQAGQFGHDGFPKPVRVPKPPRNRARMRRGPKLAAALAVAAVAVAATTAAVVVSGSNPTRTAAAGRGGQQAGLPGPGSGPAAPAAPAESASASSRPARGPAASATLNVTGVTGTGPVASPAPGVTPTAQQSASPAPEPSASPTPSSSSSPAAGTLQLSSSYIKLVSVNDQLDIGSVTLTAVGGPIANFSVTISGAGRNLIVWPLSGPLAAGQQAVVTVEGYGRRSFSAYLTFSPGGQVVVVHVQAKRVT